MEKQLLKTKGKKQKEKSKRNLPTKVWPQLPVDY